MAITQQILTDLFDKCEIYLYDSLISEEWILKRYAEFFAASLSDDERSSSIALHTGSICFDAIACVVAAVACILSDDTDADSFREYLKTLKKGKVGKEDGDIILFDNEHYMWLGMKIVDGHDCFALEKKGKQRGGRKQSGGERSMPYDENWHRLKPCDGNAKSLGSRGMIKIKDNRKDNRADFISYILGNNSEYIVPGVTKFSTVIVAKPNRFEDIAEKLLIRYGNEKEKEVRLLELVTGSSYTDNANKHEEPKEHPFKGNTAMNDPVLKVTRDVSTARELVLKKDKNIIGFMVINPQAIKKGGEELSGLLHRKSLKFVHAASAIDTAGAEEIVNNIVGEQDGARVFACTKEFLRQNPAFLEQRRYNKLTNELNGQIDKIVNNNVTVSPVNSGFSLEQYKKVEEILCKLRNTWTDDLKQFVISACSLLKLFRTATFSMRKLEEAINNGVVKNSRLSPKLKLEELRESAKKTGSRIQLCEEVSNVLDAMYENIIDDCPKYVELKSQLSGCDARRIAVIVPKAYYSDILTKDEELRGCGVTFVTTIADEEELNDSGVTIVTWDQSHDSEYYDWIIDEEQNSCCVTVVTPNRFDASKNYDRIIVVGNLDPWRSKAAADINVLLYDCESRFFKHNMRKAEKFERDLNSRQNILETIIIDVNNEAISGDDIDAVDKEFAILEKSIEIEMDIFDDIQEYSTKGDRASAGATNVEVYALGCFADGERMYFSKYYKALVLDKQNNQITETNVTDLALGDVLVLQNRDNYTQNTVDYIYSSLMETGKFGFGEKASEVTRKAAYWKKVLREYQCKGNYSFRELTDGLREYGSTLQEGAIRQWLAEESHVVGPRDEETLKHIARLTKDTELRDDTTAEYYDAIHCVRHARRNILNMMSDAIVEQLEGKKPQEGSEFEIVFNSVNSYCKRLELERFEVFDNPKTVPSNIINKLLS